MITSVNINEFHQLLTRVICPGYDSGWVLSFNVFIWGLQIVYVNVSLKLLANNVDSDQMPHSVVFELGLHGLLRPI